jgi:hypothetical protein
LDVANQSAFDPRDNRSGDAGVSGDIVLPQLLPHAQCAEMATDPA